MVPNSPLQKIMNKNYDYLFEFCVFMIFLNKYRKNSMSVNSLIQYDKSKTIYPNLHYKFDFFQTELIWVLFSQITNPNSPDESTLAWIIKPRVVTAFSQPNIKKTTSQSGSSYELQTKKVRETPCQIFSI
jgi:uncharacterized membrane protein